MSPADCIIEPITSLIKDYLDKKLDLGCDRLLYIWKSMIIKVKKLTFSLSK